MDIYIYIYVYICIYVENICIYVKNPIGGHLCEQRYGRPSATPFAKPSALPPAGPCGTEHRRRQPVAVRQGVRKSSLNGDRKGVRKSVCKVIHEGARQYNRWSKCIYICFIYIYIYI